METFGSFVIKIKQYIQSKGDQFILFIKGDYGLGCPPFVSKCNFNSSVAANVRISCVSIVGFERIEIFKSVSRDSAVGVYVENSSDLFIGEAIEKMEIFGRKIKKISKDDKSSCSSFYIELEI